MLTKVLVANRGEIARRIMRTCRALGLGTVAVYSDADAGSPHVREADEAVRIGPAAASASYLRVDRIIEAARRTGADGIHPGYGFLAENAAFAAAVVEAGLCWVGPRPETIRAMGDKAAARVMMEARGVPVAPGYAGEAQDAETLAKAAARIGYPVLVKAAAGGGGKGMVIVRSAEGLGDAVAGARRLAEGAFGDGRLILERYIDSPRHIEVQIVGDTHGSVVHFWERECSIQRRFQKIIEEAPAGIDEALRAALCEAAIRAGEALGYVGAGTVEFIVAPDGGFYFLEVNTRLQVEHPVTEAITGHDLVALQLEVAMGGAVPAQESIERYGHAIEVRVYAEDPAQGFLPQAGRLVEWSEPRGVRVDSGVVEGGVVGIDYDPMLAKVIAWDETRARATRRMVRALCELGVAGVATNRAFLVDVLRHEAWAAGALSTHFIGDHFADWAPRVDVEAARRRAVAAALWDALDRDAARPGPRVRAGWRNNPDEPMAAVWDVDGVEVSVAYRAEGGGRFWARVDGDEWALTVEREARRLALSVATGGDGIAVRRWLWLRADGERRYVRDVDGASVCVERPRFPEAAGSEAAGGCVAPMPGKVVAVLVEAGAEVAKGAGLVILEAMKMEQTLVAERAGRVGEVRVAAGDVVDAGAILIVLAAPEADGSNEETPGK